MLTAGIDVGTRNTKVVIIRDDKEILGRGSVITGFDQKASVEEAFNQALQEAKATMDEIVNVTATGAGRKVAPYANDEITEIGANAKGALFLVPSARTVVDVGAEESRALGCDANGRVKDFAVNERCAAGAGTFIETMARILETSVEGFARLSLESTKSVPMNAQCAIFAESEVVSLVHTDTALEDIAGAVHEAIADRVVAIVRRVGVENDVVLAGGMARNPGFVEALKKTLGSNVLVPEYPEFVSALGAALTHNQN